MSLVQVLHEDLRRPFIFYTWHQVPGIMFANRSCTGYTPRVALLVLQSDIKGMILQQKTVFCASSLMRVAKYQRNNIAASMPPNGDGVTSALLPCKTDSARASWRRKQSSLPPPPSHRLPSNRPQLPLLRVFSTPNMHRYGRQILLQVVQIGSVSERHRQRRALTSIWPYYSMLNCVRNCGITCTRRCLYYYGTVVYPGRQWHGHHKYYQVRGWKARVHPCRLVSLLGLQWWSTSHTTVLLKVI